jgi:hypothetical protein
MISGSCKAEAMNASAWEFAGELTVGSMLVLVLVLAFVVLLFTGSILKRCPVTGGADLGAGQTLSHLYILGTINQQINQEIIKRTSQYDIVVYKEGGLSRLQCPSRFVFT